MHPVSDRFLAALETSQVIVTRVELLVAGEVALSFDDVDAEVTSGKVTIDGKASVRRRLDLELADPTGWIVPRAIGDGLLVPPNELRIWQGLRFPDGTDELAPLGVFGISRPEVSDDGGLLVKLDGYDRSRRVARNKWTGPWVITRGTNLGTAIADLLVDRDPTIEVLNFAETAETTPLVILGEDASSDPWEDARNLAAAGGLELFVDPQGIPVLRPVPDAATDPVTGRYAEGEGARLLAKASRAFDDDPGVNGIIVISEGTDVADPFRVEVWDDDPASPTYYLGPWGKVPEVLTSELILTEDQGFASARALLRQRLGTVEDVRFTTAAAPIHDAGDVIEIYRPRLHLDARYVLETGDVPLGPGTMDWTTRPRVVTS